MDFTITPMSIEHYEAAYALWESTEGVSVGEADSKQQIARQLERNPGCSFVALADGVLIGAVLCGHDGRRGFVHHLAVAAEHRGKGIARRLVDSSLAALRDAGVHQSHIFVMNLHPSAIEFWEHHGWELRRDLAAFRRVVE